MPPAVEELPTGQQPDRRQSRRVRKIDFGQLDGLSTSADQELRETDGALLAFMEQQAKRDALYVESRDELKQKYQFGGWTAWHKRISERRRSRRRDRAAGRGPRRASQLPEHPPRPATLKRPSAR